MIPVDLNRLREARDDLNDNYRESDVLTLTTLEATAGAVLDAPTVWFCSSAHRIGCSGPKDASIPMREAHADCGFVNLVPVKGEN